MPAVSCNPPLLMWYRNKPPTAVDLFNFGWTLYIYVKGALTYLPAVGQQLLQPHRLHAVPRCAVMVFMASTPCRPVPPDQ